MEDETRSASGISRRGFLASIGAIAGVAAAGGLVGCSASGPNTVDDADTGTTAASSETPSFMVAPDPIADSAIKQTYSADVIVVGSGVSGLCCAVSAIESGCDVIVISAGSMAVGRGGSNQAIGSKYQAEHGIVDGPQYRRNIFRDEQLAGTMQMNKKLWSRWVMSSHESMDWMIDKMAAKGLSCSLEPAYIDPDGTLTGIAGSHNFWNSTTTLGVLLGAPLIAQAYADTFTDDFGSEIRYSTTACQLVREDDNTGRVSACIAQNVDGDYERYEAKKAVVLATGDFSKDEEMMKYYSPVMYGHFKDAITFNDPVNYDVEMSYTGLMPGTGQKMGLWIGAGWQKCYPNPCAVNGGAAGPTHYVIDQFWGINLDVNGKRYQNECTNFAFGALSKLNLPQQTAYSVWDTAYASTQDKWETLGGTIDDVTGVTPLTPDQQIAYWETQVEAGTFFKADTLDELLDELDGIDKGNALASIERYNKYAEQGYDEEFLVNPDILFPITTPPFYGAKSTGATFLCVMGGLRTDENLQVCEDDDTPIEGLYNVGTMIGDFYANGYNFGLPGQNLGAACGTLPYLLGRDLAAL